MTGHRVKTGYPHITWVHKQKQFKDFHINQYLLGAHLVSHSDKPIAIVENEKTAVIISIFYPDFIWLATGGIQNLNRRIWGPLLCGRRR